MLYTLLRRMLLLMVLGLAACATSGGVTTAQERPAEVISGENSMEVKHARNGRRNRIPPLKIYDPWEKLNRKIYAMNDVMDRFVAKPIAKGYRKVVPRPVRSGIRNFLHNLMTPMYLVHGLLQWDFRYMGIVTSRFIVNSTVGIGGLMDVGTKTGIRLPHKKDMGQTLGKYGMGTGPFIIIPFLGPTTLRDGIGIVADSYVNPVYYNGLEIGSDSPWIDELGIRLGMTALNLIDLRANMLDNMDGILENSFDKYAMTRSAYLQYRHKLVYGGRRRKRRKKVSSVQSGVNRNNESR